MKPNTDTRAGRMLDGLISSANKSGKVLLTTTVTDAAGGKRLHETFALRKWTGKNATLLFVAIPTTADWENDVKPVTPVTINLDTGEIRDDHKDSRVTPLLRYAAHAALRYALTGEAPQPGNGKVEVLESVVCGMCGAPLTDPVSIERGIGPDCIGKPTCSKTLKAWEAARKGNGKTGAAEQPQEQGDLLALAKQIGAAA